MVDPHQRRRISFEVMPFQVPTAMATEDYCLVLFTEISPALPLVNPPEPSSAATPPSSEEITRLQQELTTTRQYLQAIIEEQEATNQDLKVANEEILSSNEELQSTNEELQTAKEEIQATNEELNTINEELHNRNLELHLVNNDLQNLLTGVNIPVLILGSDLRIRRFTPMAEKLFNLISTDVGRPFKDIRANIDLPNLEALIAEMIDTLSIQEQELQDESGHWYLLRIRPYKTTENRIEGAVIVLVDIDDSKQSLRLLAAARDYAEAIVETVRHPLIVLDGDFRIQTTNQAFYKLFKLLPQEVENQLLFELGEGEWEIPQLRSLLEDILPHNTHFEDFEVHHGFEQIGTKTLLLNACQVVNAGDLILLAIEDVTER
ncbi:PAS domain-containing protein [Neosynechococcus sphagnicola]|uniref:PAS domain-containing protein n=1 Tax=Neosynechococcus sphagnicola TaxID=1501145 RepID=UPI00138DF552|nr:PAS domain-containing protein [Neosynechococcus sphagnicola]